MTLSNLNGNAANATESTPAATPQEMPALKQTSYGIYRQLALLDRRTHAGKRVRQLTDWSLARETNAVFASVVEFYDIAREYPIAFVAVGKNDKNQPIVTPVAMLGLKDGQNVYVDATGQWNALYIPAFLRRYPFSFVQTVDNQMGLGVDEAWAGFNDSEGELLIDEAGEMTPFMQRVLSFLDNFEQDVQRTRFFCDKLVELNLLRAGEIGGQLANGETVKAQGFFLIDEQKLRELPDATVLELFRNGMLGLINAHLLSVGQVPQLARRVQSTPVAAQNMN
jgi:hypothetical protein